MTNEYVEKSLAAVDGNATNIPDTTTLMEVCIYIYIYIYIYINLYITNIPDTTTLMEVYIY